jgi:hypothetical protein
LTWQYLWGSLTILQLSKAFGRHWTTERRRSPDWGPPLNAGGLEWCRNLLAMIAMDQINAAYGRLFKSDVKYRFVIDMGTLGRAA